MGLVGAGDRYSAAVGNTLRARAHVARELAASRVDVVAAWGSGDADVTRIAEDITKGVDAALWGTLVVASRKRVERNQVDFRWNVTKQFGQLPGIGVRIIDTVEHDVLEGDVVAL